MKEATISYLALVLSSIFSNFIPAVISLVYYKRLKTESFSLALVILFCFLALGDFIGSFIIGFLMRKYNMPWFHIATFLELIFLGWAYYKSLPSFQKILPFVLIPAILFKLSDSFFLEGMFKFDAYSKTMSSILLTVLSLLYFYQIFLQKTLVALEKQIMFWISCGVLLYYAGSTLIVGFYNIMLDQQTTEQTWKIHSVLATIANILYGIGMSCSPKPKTV